MVLLQLSMRHFYLFSFSLLLLSGCLCKSGPYEVLGLKVSYPTLNEPSTLYSIQFVNGNPNQITDTLEIGELNESNNYSLFVPLNEMAFEHILFVDNTDYQDTITDILERRDRCGNEIKTLEFQLNGEMKSGKELAIQ